MKIFSNDLIYAIKLFVISSRINFSVKILNYAILETKKKDNNDNLI